MATITTDDVQHVATLARLEFKEEDIEEFTHQLARILDYIGKLNELNTTDVAPTSHPLTLRNVVKADVAKSSYDRDVVLEGAPSVEEGYFEVPKVIE